MQTETHKGLNNPLWVSDANQLFKETLSYPGGDSHMEEMLARKLETLYMETVLCSLRINTQKHMTALIFLKRHFLKHNPE